MNLTPGEKIIITMLADIKNHFEMEGEIDHQFVTNAIFRDHLWALDWKMQGMNFPREDTPRHVSQVVDILDMWDVVEMSFERLDAADQAAIEANTSLHHPRFAGFDGNNETSHMGAARFLVQDLERFTRFNGRGFNSHYPSLGRYLEMVQEYEAVGNAWVDRDPRGLTREEIERILSRGL